MVDGEYQFSLAGDISPNLIGHDVDEFDIVLKYVSDYDLVSYGATKEVVDGESVFSWDSNLDNIKDKYGQASAPLEDLDGKVITNPGWYDFTLRETEDTDPDLDIFVPVW